MSRRRDWGRQRHTLSPSVIQREAIEYSLTDHCNLKCVRCDHASPLLPPRFASLDSFRADVNALAAVFHAREFRVVGGEPLLHPRLFEFIETARASGIAGSITLITNGVLLHKFGDSLFERIDTLWISRYPKVRVSMPMNDVRRLALRHNVRLIIRRVRTFRHTLIDEPHQDPAVVQRIFRDCDLTHRWSCHTFQDGYYFKCTPAPVLAPRLARTGITLSGCGHDGVKLHDNPGLKEELVAYLANKLPLHACQYCLGTSGRRFPHLQAKAADAAVTGNTPVLIPRPLLLLRRSARSIAGTLWPPRAG